jgi:hypothetical protein
MRSERFLEGARRDVSGIETADGTSLRASLST